MLYFRKSKLEFYRIQRMMKRQEQIVEVQMYWKRALHTVTNMCDLSTHAVTDLPTPFCIVCMHVVV